MAKRRNKNSKRSSTFIWIILIGIIIWAIYDYQSPDSQIKIFLKNIKNSPDTYNPTSSPTDTKDFVPEADFGLPSHPASAQIIRHTGYTLCYEEKYEQPSWVAYKLEGKHTKGHAERGNDFRADPAVATLSAAPLDYRNSGYDKGHLAPAADFKYDNKLMSETFFMSNMSPQAPDFNRGIWRILEEQVRDWAQDNKTIYIVTGPILEPGLKKIGRNKVSVPHAYYKIIVDMEDPEIKAIAFLMKNEGSTKTIKDFVVSIDAIEQQTGIDFFPQLSKTPDLEKRLEGTIQEEQWFK